MKLREKDTREVVKGLKCCAGNAAMCGECYLSTSKKCTTILKQDAIEHIAELERKKENLIDHNADLNNRLNKAESHIEKLEKQLSEKQPEPEWISVEDERKPDEDETCIVMTSTDCIYNLKYSKYGFPKAHRIRYWMHKPALPEPPKPKVPTFKDVFLKAFPKAPLSKDGVPCVCIADVFPWGIPISCEGIRCNRCWNQPYFEGEGGE